MAQSNINNLVTLIKRLEAATSRLEDIATTASGTEIQGAGSTGGSNLGDTFSGAGPVVASATPAAPSQPQEPLPPSIEGFDALINGEVKKFTVLSENIGGLVAQQAAGVLQTFAAERKFLVVTTKAKKPDISSPVYMQCLTEMQKAIGHVNELRESNRQSPFFAHLSMVSEGIPMVAWVTVDRKPQDSVTEMLNGAQFYGNRVIKEYKDKEQAHVDWVRSFYTICQALTAYIEEFYPSGLTWNQKDGIDAADALKQVEAGNISSSQKSKAAGGPPPPPLPSTGSAPPPPPPPPPGGVAKSSAGADMGAVFADISKGESVTKGLRKVDPSQQTHKNPSLRGGAAVGADPKRSDSLNSQSSGGRGKSPIPGRKPESMRTKKPPRKELDGNKWYIENYDAPPERVVEIQAEITHSILITKCSKTTFRIHGKANAISIDSSAQIGLVVDSLVSSVEIIKVPRFEMQVLGKLPTILLDQVDGASVYLSKDSLATEVFTSKCTGVNINVPGKTEEDDYNECPVPEQIKTVIRHGQAISEIVEHAG